jgi:hypothetical protein
MALGVSRQGVLFQGGKEIEIKSDAELEEAVKLLRFKWNNAERDKKTLIMEIWEENHNEKGS